MYKIERIETGRNSASLNSSLNFELLHGQPELNKSHGLADVIFPVCTAGYSYIYTLRLPGPISYLGSCYIVYACIPR